MNPIQHIRKNVLGVSQADLAKVAGVSQGTVSKWENGELKPDLDELGRIRDEAHRRGLEWNDGWFFEGPKPPGDAPPLAPVDDAHADPERTS
jgi:transcriptional regulator with XRE-family HTH domain